MIAQNHIVGDSADKFGTVEDCESRCTTIIDLSEAWVRFHWSFLSMEDKSKIENSILNLLTH